MAHTILPEARLGFGQPSGPPLPQGLLWSPTSRSAPRHSPCAQPRGTHPALSPAALTRRLSCVQYTRQPSAAATPKNARSFPMW